VADLFCATRLGAPAPVLGALPAGAGPSLDAVLARALP
jgi:hypothetical protein